MGVWRPSRHAIRIKINIYVSILNRGNRFYTVGIQQLDKDIYVIYIFCIYIHFYFTFICRSAVSWTPDIIFCTNIKMNLHGGNGTKIRKYEGWGVSVMNCRNTNTGARLMLMLGVLTRYKTQGWCCTELSTSHSLRVDNLNLWCFNNICQFYINLWHI